MMPAELMSCAVSMSADATPEFLDLLEELFSFGGLVSLTITCMSSSSGSVSTDTGQRDPIEFMTTHTPRLGAEIARSILGGS
jgi:hypothetical protein